MLRGAAGLRDLSLWLAVGLVLGALEWPYQLLSELGFLLQQRLWLEAEGRRLPLMVLTHVAGFSVGVESPSAALGAALLLALRRRWPAVRAWADLPIPLIAAIGGGAGLVLPTLLLAGSGALVATSLGQPARLGGLELGGLEGAAWPLAALLTVLGAGLGSLFVRVLIPLAAWLSGRLRAHRFTAALAVAGLLALLAWFSGGLSLNDGSLSLAAALQADGGGSMATLLWRFMASLLSIAAAVPGGLMHDTMALGSLLASPLTFLPVEARGQLAAVGAVVLFAAANRTPLFCALFVFTLQGDPQLLPVLLLVSGVSSALAECWCGLTWNEAQREPRPAAS